MAKMEIRISGPRVHDVGYRYLLLGGAMGPRLPGFDANNLIDGKNQIVDIVVEGKESQIDAFREFVENNKPADARVSDITASDYDGDVMRIAEYSQVLTATQMLKAIPVLLEIRDITSKTQNNTEGILGEIHGLRGDLNRRLAGIEKDMDVVKLKLKA